MAGVAGRGGNVKQALQDLVAPAEAFEASRDGLG
jgi:hypothetical protein